MLRKDLKILLLQIRDDANVRKEELESFAKYSELDLAQIDVLNGYHALYVGGASEANVLEPQKY